MKKVAVVIPCYRVRNHVLGVIERIGPEVCRIYAIDDCCPEQSGAYIEELVQDSRIKVIYNAENLGVGGAVMAGYQAALDENMDIIVKIDGDGQMDPALLSRFIAPLLAGEADYAKGNRFYDLESLRDMPSIRLFGNAMLSFMTKLSSGYWNLFDPTNGYTAIHAEAARHLPFDKISRRYFFETDMLFRLNTIRAVVTDIPMDSHYGDEQSSLEISRIIGEFFYKHVRNFGKRIFYNYYLRDMSVASLELPLGLALFMFGVVFGSDHWLHSITTEQSSSAGTVMLSALPIIIGLQFMLSFLNYDMNSTPTKVFHKYRLAEHHES